jgi:hypothetical protein
MIRHWVVQFLHLSLRPHVSPVEQLLPDSTQPEGQGLHPLVLHSEQLRVTASSGSLETSTNFSCFRPLITISFFICSERLHFSAIGSHVPPKERHHGDCDRYSSNLLSILGS